MNPYADGQLLNEYARKFESLKQQGRLDDMKNMLYACITTDMRSIQPTLDIYRQGVYCPIR